MTSVPAMLLLFFLLSVAVRAQENQSNLIGLGSSLSPSTHHTSWLSSTGLFAFGFYPHGYGFAVGIWLIGQPQNTLVWTANRDDPPVSSNATLDFTKDGQLLLRSKQLGQEKPVIELREIAVSASMLDSGNFVFYNNNSRVIWQSFDFPTDTLLGGQNLSSGDKLISSVSTSNGSSGRFYLAMQSDGNLVAYPVNSTAAPEDAYWSSNTLGISATLNLNHRGLLGFRNSAGRNVRTVANGTSYSGESETIIYRATLDADGVFRLYSHSFRIGDDNPTVSPEWSSLQNQCEVKGFCGFNSFCSSNGSTKADCFCFPGFVFVNPDMRFLGCYRSFNDEDCRRKELSLSYSIASCNNTTLGGFPYSMLSMSNEDCSNSCLKDCDCGAALYSNGVCSRRKLPLTYGRVNQNETTTLYLRVGGDYNYKPPIPGDPIVMIESKKKLIQILACANGVIMHRLKSIGTLGRMEAFIVLVSSCLYVMGFSCLSGPLNWLSETFRSGAQDVGLLFDHHWVQHDDELCDG
ncbi:hypothetical protein L1049_002365 [Liquidambar formosana]|uniref:Bulb-type lectin domain-containing protein n=1 Tax=Liquidambar formosana TaxID=63359 RepID=A0AAP0R999_LIQFO